MRSLLPIPAGVAVLAIVAWVVPIDHDRTAAGVFRSGNARLPPGVHVIFHRDGKTATVDVLRDGPLRGILTNGKSDAAIVMDPASRKPTPDETTMALLAMMPLTQMPEAKTAAVIGFGSGMSTDVMLRSPNIRSVDTIEIEPAMVQGARNFLPIVAGAFDDPRSHIVIDDAKSYFARGRHRYDIIVSEPSNPWVSGVASLFTEEFYRRLALSLNDGGVLSQWMHTYEMDSVTLASILEAVAKTFPDFVVYSSGEADLVLIARKGRAPAKPDVRLLEWPAMRPVVQRLELQDPAVMRERSFGSSASILALFGALHAPANSDYHPLVEQRTSRTRFTKESVKELMEMQAADMPLLEMFDGTSTPADHPVRSLAMTVAVRASIDAWGFRQLVLDPSFVAPGPAPPSDSREHAAKLIAMWAASCPANLRFDRLLPSIVFMARVINAHVDSRSAGDVWRVLSNSACAKKLAPAERRWLELFAAVAARDAAAMSRVGIAVLDASRGRRDTATQYAFEATATGLVCRHRFAEANRLFALGARDWLPTGGAPISLRYLYALANLPPGAPWPAGEDCKAH